MKNINEKVRGIIADIAENEEMTEIYLNYISLSNEDEKSSFWQNLTEKVSQKSLVEQQIFHKNLQKGLLTISTRVATLAGGMLETVK